MADITGWFLFSGLASQDEDNTAHHDLSWLGGYVFRFKLAAAPRDASQHTFVKRNSGFVQKRLRPGCYQIQGCYSTVAAQLTGFPAERMCFRFWGYMLRRRRPVS